MADTIISLRQRGVAQDCKSPRTYVRGFFQNASFACLKSSSRSLESLIHPRTHVRGSSKVVLEMIGKNSAMVLHPTQVRNRLLLGEFAFFPGNLYHYTEAKAKYPKAPIGYRWFKDGTGTTKLYFTVPKGARHPAAGTLFALWMGTPEAEAIWQPTTFHSNIRWGQSDQDKMVRKNLKESGYPILSFYDSPKKMKLLKWFGTLEGKKYRRKIAKLVRQRK